MSFKGLLNIGSQMALTAVSSASTLVSFGTQPDSMCAHDAEIQGDVLAFFRAIVDHQDVAWVHVGVKKSIAEYLGKENFHPVVRKLTYIYALFTQ